MTLTAIWVTRQGEKVAIELPPLPVFAWTPPAPREDDLESTWQLPAFIPPAGQPLWRPGRDKIRPDRKAAWLRELRSGRWRQIFGTYTDDADGRCALGIITHHLLARGAVTAIEYLGLSDDAYWRMSDAVINLNDHQHKSFVEIADYIEATW